jgi:glucose/arabinose dehydrogenase
MNSIGLFRLLAGLVLCMGLTQLHAFDEVSLEPAFGAAMFDFPLAVRHAGDGSGRRFVLERGGRIRIVSPADIVLEPPFLDLTAIVDTTGEGGLLGLAFHPQYADNGRFYVNYTYDGNPDGTTWLITRIAEFQVRADDDNLADPDSERVILEIPQDFNNHNGGDLHFGPDGYLWIATGDGGSGNDPCNRGQTLDPADLVPDCGNHPDSEAKALLGKMIRIDVDRTTEPGTNRLCGAGNDGAANYAVPDDNPYVVPEFVLFADRFEPLQEACAETWSYGLRNPYRFSFDRANGDLWLSDVGQSSWEEINLEPAGDAGGRNYGWRVCEGNWLRGSTTDPCDLDGHTGPVMEYRTGPEDNCAVTGGYRYRGPVTALAGQYIFGDFCSGRIWFAQPVGGTWEMEEFIVLDGFGNLVGFGEDEAGELYLTRGNGQVLRFDGPRD